MKIAALVSVVTAGRQTRDVLTPFDSTINSTDIFDGSGNTRSIGTVKMAQLLFNYLGSGLVQSRYGPYHMGHMISYWLDCMKDAFEFKYRTYLFLKNH